MTKLLSGARYAELKSALDAKIADAVRENRFAAMAYTVGEGSKEARDESNRVVEELNRELDLLNMAREESLREGARQGTEKLHREWGSVSALVEVKLDQRDEATARYREALKAAEEAWSERNALGSEVLSLVRPWTKKAQDPGYSMARALGGLRDSLAISRETFNQRGDVDVRSYIHAFEPRLEEPA